MYQQKKIAFQDELRSGIASCGVGSWMTGDHASLGHALQSHIHSARRVASSSSTCSQRVPREKKKHFVYSIRRSKNKQCPFSFLLVRFALKQFGSGKLARLFVVVFSKEEKKFFPPCPGESCWRCVASYAYKEPLKLRGTQLTDAWTSERRE